MLRKLNLLCLGGGLLLCAGCLLAGRSQDFAAGGGECLDRLTNAIEQTKRASRRFAKRQLTWLRDAREGTVHWVPPIEDGGAAAVIRLWNTHTEERRES